MQEWLMSSLKFIYHSKPASFPVHKQSNVMSRTSIDETNVHYLCSSWAEYHYEVGLTLLHGIRDDVPGLRASIAISHHLYRWRYFIRKIFLPCEQPYVPSPIRSTLPQYINTKVTHKRLSKVQFEGKAIWSFTKERWVLRNDPSRARMMGHRNVRYPWWGIMKKAPTPPTHYYYNTTETMCN